MPTYARPIRMDEALQIAARGGYSVLAGGTDYYPALVGRRNDRDVLDLTALAELRGIVKQREHWRIGATTTWTELIEAKLPPLFDGLKQAAREVGGRQIQNTGTIAGNLCNASAAADGVPALLALDASLALSSSAATRVVPLGKFIVGPRKTVLGSKEIVTAILVPNPAHAASSAFLKLGARKYLVISIAMASTVIEHRAGKVVNARVAVGACSPVALRLPALEAQLIGKRFDASMADCVDGAQLAVLRPLDDVRADAAYRRQAALELLRRLLRGMA